MFEGSSDKSMLASSPATRIPLSAARNGGVEALIYAFGKKLAQQPDIEVTLAAPKYSYIPGMKEVIETVNLQSPLEVQREDLAFKRYSKRLKEFDAVHDFSVAGDQEFLLERNQKLVRQNLKDYVWQSGDRTFTVTADNKVVLASISAKTEHAAQELVQVTLEDGSYVRVSPNHAFFTEEDVCIEAGNALGKIIKTPRQLVYSCTHHIDLVPTSNTYLEGLEVRQIIKDNWERIRGPHYYHRAYDWKKHDILPTRILVQRKIPLPKNFQMRGKHGHRLTSPLQLTNLFGFFVGAWLGDGSSDTWNVFISTFGDKDFEKRLIEFGKEIGIQASITPTRTIFSSRILSEQCKHIGLAGYSHTKRIPADCYGWPEGAVCGLLCGYFSADGWVANNSVFADTASEKLAFDITTLLRRVGITARVHKFKNQKSAFVTQREHKWRIAITHRDNVIPFINKIGFAQKTKMLAFKDWHYKQWKKQPIMNEVILRKIVHIKSDGFEPVYDLSIPNAERFIVANILVHNSHKGVAGRIRQKLPYVKMLWHGYGNYPEPKYNLMALSEWHAGAMKEIYKQEVRHLHMGVDTDFYKPLSENVGGSRAQVGSSIGDYFVFIGHAMPTKGMVEAIAYARKANVNLHITGQSLPPEQAQYRQRAVELCDGKQIIWHGEVSNEIKRDELRAARGFLFPVQQDEASSLAIMEALSCGVPVITANRAAYPELVTNDVGVCCKTEDEYLNVIANKAALESFDCEKIRQRALNLFSLERMVNNYVKVYSELASGVRW